MDELNNSLVIAPTGKPPPFSTSTSSSASSNSSSEVFSMENDAEDEILYAKQESTTSQVTSTSPLSSTSPQQQSKKIKLNHSNSVNNSDSPSLPPTFPSSSLSSSSLSSSSSSSQSEPTSTSASLPSSSLLKKRNSSLSSLNTLMDACPLDDLPSSTELDISTNATFMKPNWHVSEFYQGSDPEVIKFLNAFLEGLALIQARFHHSPTDLNEDKEWIYELATECDLNVFPQLLALQPTLSDPTQLVSFLLATETILQHHFPYPDLLCSLLLPQLRSVFPLPVFAKALLLHPSTRGNPEALLTHWLVGRLNKASDIELLGELAATCYAMALDVPPVSTDPGLCIFFQALAKQAAGWHPYCYSSLLCGFASSLFQHDLHVLISFFTTCYPTLHAYEKGHGDFGWMVSHFHRCKNVIDSTSFFLGVSTYWWNAMPNDTETQLGLKLTHVYLLPTRPFPAFMETPASSTATSLPLWTYNAVTQGACAYHVRLALRYVPEHWVSYFVTLFNVAYEVPLLGLTNFPCSWRLSDWTLILPPDLAFQTCFTFFLNHPSHSALVHPEFPDLGFLEPNAFDLVEQQLGKDMDTIEGQDNGHLRQSHQGSDIDLAGVDVEPDQAFIELCMQHVEKANGDLSQIDVDALVDVLMAQQQHAS